jgi:hypothetical protein
MAVLRREANFLPVLCPFSTKQRKHATKLKGKWKEKQECLLSPKQSWTRIRDTRWSLSPEQETQDLLNQNIRGTCAP